jgi:hypothetical protein
MKTKVSQKMIEAYANTDFRVGAHIPFVLKIGIQNKSLLELYAQEKFDCAAYITAFNPYSEERTEKENSDAQDSLLQQLSLSAFKIIEGSGQDPLGEWPSEPSALALGMSKTEAMDIGNKFRQNAIVWMGADAIPELIMLR